MVASLFPLGQREDSRGFYNRGQKECIFQPKGLEGTVKLKIVMLSIHSCPLGKIGAENTGGMSVYIREVARQLGRRGHLVDVYTRLHEPIHDPVLEIGPNVRVIHLKAGEERTKKTELYFHLDDFARDLEEFKKRYALSYDLIHSHYWLSGLVGKRLQQWWGIPHIMGFHTLGAVKNTLGLGQDESAVRIHAENELVKGCDRIIDSTEKGKKDLITFYQAAPETISIIPCGVNLDLFQPIRKEMARNHLRLNGERIILFVGRIVPLKGLDNLLKAVSCMKMKSKIRLIVIGGDEHSRLEMERLEHLSRRLKIDGSVTFLGLINQEILPFFYSAADLCVVPSFYETFGLVALESLACGTPVLATRVGGAEWVIRQGETGYIVPDNDPHRLAEKMDLLLSTSKKRPVYADSVRSSVARYSWSNIAEALIEEYRGVLKNFS
jgi:D-inositol-3-phosphate glycosyltransferase